MTDVSHYNSSLMPLDKLLPHVNDSITSSLSVTPCPRYHQIYPAAAAVTGVTSHHLISDHMTTTPSPLTKPLL